MIFRAMERAGVFPPASVVNIGDTLADVESGRNAGVWSVGVAATGNMLGLTLDEWLALPNDERELGLAAAREAMRNHGAHFVVDRLSDCPAVIEHINACLAAGCQP
jgi:phosphonoacetaldehyde hydrolase